MHICRLPGTSRSTGLPYSPPRGSLERFLRGLHYSTGSSTGFRHILFSTLEPALDFPVAAEFLLDTAHVFQVFGQRIVTITKCNRADTDITWKSLGAGSSKTGENTVVGASVIGTSVEKGWVFGSPDSRPARAPEIKGGPRERHSVWRGPTNIGRDFWLCQIFQLNFTSLFRKTLLIRFSIYQRFCRHTPIHIYTYAYTCSRYIYTMYVS